MPANPFDFSMLAAQGQTPEQNYGLELQKSMMDAPREGENQFSPELQRGLAGLADFAARSKVANEAASIPSPPDKISMSTDPNGKKIVKVETSQENYENTTRSAMNWHQALGGMQQQMERQDQMLKAREEQIRSQPAWVQLATALSANLAQQKDMPGWVQGLGRTAAQLNPQADQVAAQRMALLGPRAQLAEKMGALAISQEHLGLERQKVDLEMTALTGREADRKETRAKTARVELDAESERYVKPFAELIKAKAGAAPNHDEFVTGFMKQVPGATKDRAESEYKQLELEVAVAQAGRAVTAQEKQEAAVTLAKALTPVMAQRAGEVAQAKVPAAMTLQDARNKAIDKRLDHRAANALESKTLSDLSHMDAKSSEQLIALRDMDEFTQNLSTVVGIAGKYKNYTGGVQGLLTDKLPTWLSSDDRQVLQHIMMVEKKRVIDFGKAGVRGWMPGEASISKLGVLAQANPVAATQIIGEIQKQIGLERKSIALRYKYAPWHEMPDMLGGVNSPIYQAAAPISQQFNQVIARTFGGQPQAPAVRDEPPSPADLMKLLKK